MDPPARAVENAGRLPARAGAAREGTRQARAARSCWLSDDDRLESSSPREPPALIVGGCPNTKLRRLGIASVEGATFHGLRRTYASLRAAVGDDPAYTFE